MALVLLPSYLLAQFKTHSMHLLLHDQNNNKKKSSKGQLNSPLFNIQYVQLKS